MGKDKYTYRAETRKRQNETNREKKAKKQIHKEKKINHSNKKSHQDFLFCQKILGVRMCCVRALMQNINLSRGKSGL